MNFHDPDHRASASTRNGADDVTVPVLGMAPGDAFHVGDVVRNRQDGYEYDGVTHVVREQGIWEGRWYELVYCPHTGLQPPQPQPKERPVPTVRFERWTEPGDVMWILTQVVNDDTRCWETVDRSRGTRADFDATDMSADDVGCQPGALLRLVLMDEHGQVIETRDVEAG